MHSRSSICSALPPERSRVQNKGGGFLPEMGGACFRCPSPTVWLLLDALASGLTYSEAHKITYFRGRRGVMN